MVDASSAACASAPFAVFACAPTIAFGETCAIVASSCFDAFPDSM